MLTSSFPLNFFKSAFACSDLFFTIKLYFGDSGHIEKRQSCKMAGTIVKAEIWLKYIWIIIFFTKNFLFLTSNEII